MANQRQEGVDRVLLILLLVFGASDLFSLCGGLAGCLGLDMELCVSVDICFISCSSVRVQDSFVCSRKSCRPLPLSQVGFSNILLKGTKVLIGPAPQMIESRVPPSIDPCVLSDVMNRLGCPLADERHATQPSDGK